MGMFELTPRALTWLRVERGLQQKELSELSGVGRAAISRYESGKATPSLENLGRLLAALGVGPRDFAARLERLREDEEGVPASYRQGWRQRSKSGAGSSLRGAYLLIDLVRGLEARPERAEELARSVAHLLERRERRG